MTRYRRNTSFTCRKARKMDGIQLVRWLLKPDSDVNFAITCISDSDMLLATLSKGIPKTAPGLLDIMKWVSSNRVITFKQFNTIYMFLTRTNPVLAEKAISIFSAGFLKSLSGKNRKKEIDNRIEEARRAVRVFNTIKEFRKNNEDM